jgi:Ca-activated chloride channel homolog
LPLSIVLAVDTSLSTRKDLPLELTSARKFAHAIVRPQDGLAVYKFSEEVSQMVPFTSDLKKIDAGIERGAMARRPRFTMRFSGIARAEPAAGKKSDGGDHRRRRHHEPGGLQRGAARGPGGGGDYLQHHHRAHRSHAGRDTGGEHALIQISSRYRAESITTPRRRRNWTTPSSQISDELRTQYLLAYYPSQRYSSSDFRQLRVDLTNAPPGGAFSRTIAPGITRTRDVLSMVEPLAVENSVTAAVNRCAQKQERRTEGSNCKPPSLAVKTRTSPRRSGRI